MSIQSDQQKLKINSEIKYEPANIFQILPEIISAIQKAVQKRFVRNEGLLENVQQSEEEFISVPLLFCLARLSNKFYRLKNFPEFKTEILAEIDKVNSIKYNN